MERKLEESERDGWVTEHPTERSGVAAVVNVLPITLRDKRGQRHVGRYYSINGSYLVGETSVEDGVN